jgi:spermidine dehydrogenase
VLACFNVVIPYLTPELPAKQKEALHLCVRGVNMRTQVALRNWKAFEKMRVASINCPGLKYPGYDGITGIMESIVSLGDYQAPTQPDEPTYLTLWGGEPRFPGRPAREQFRAGRAALYETSFETFERRIRTHLARVLSEGGFDPASDIAAITINRWPHGFAMGANYLFDPDWSDDEVPWVVGRKRFGRIAIANSDAGAVCLTQCAFDQAHRAVDDLNPRHMAWWTRI